MKKAITIFFIILIILAGCNPASNNNDNQIDYSYNLIEKSYIENNLNIAITYYQIENIKDKQVMSNINQSLYEIVNIYGKDYTDLIITSKIIKSDEYITIKYEGQNQSPFYTINSHITININTGVVLTISNTINDMKAFEILFEDTSGYKYSEQEGVKVYLEDEKIIFTFVPTDDTAKREYIHFNIIDIESILNF